MIKEIRGHVVEFIEETHQYFVDGIETPSVSTILSKTIFKDKYSGIPQHVLDLASKYGTSIHLAIEIDMTDHLETREQFTAFRDWKKIQEDNFIVPTKQENMIYSELGYCGTYDMEAVVMGYLCLLDVKTTSKLDAEYISWQLSMYEYASGKTFDKLYAIWLPKRQYGLPKLHEVERKTEQEIKDLIRSYHEQTDIK